MADYDVIVIGAGNGGLTGALTLRNAGKKVLIIDRNNVPGGYACTFRRGRFEFEGSLHQLYGISDNPDGSKGHVREMLEELGVYDKLEFVLQPEAARMVAGPMDITMPGGHDEFVDALKAAAPEEADQIDKLQALCDQFTEETYDMMRAIGNGDPFTEERFPAFYKYGMLKANEVVDSFLSNPAANMAYKLFYGFVGLPLEECPFFSYAHWYGRGEGTCYVKGGSQAMSAAIANEFIKKGGEIKFNTAVEKIIVEDGVVKGVRTDSGEVITADVVLSNANKLNVYVDLIDEDQVPEEEFANLRVSKPTHSCYSAYLGFDRSAEDLGITNCTTFIIPQDKLPDRFDIDMRLMDAGDDLRTGFLMCSCYNIEDPDCSPEGTCIVTVSFLKNSDYFEDLSPDLYHREKYKYAEMAVEHFFRVYPKARGHVETFEVATPLTYMRYAQAPKGAIYGIEMNAKDLFANKFQVDSPIRGLYFCGATIMLDGFNWTLTSGREVGRRILKDMAAPRPESEKRFVYTPDGIPHGEEVKKDIEVSKHYNIDHRTTRGKIKYYTERLHPKKIEFRVTEIRKETETAKTIRLTPIGGYVPPFLPGQFVNLEFSLGGIRTTRAYSISSSSAERGYYEITVRRNKNGFVSDYILDKLMIGDTVYGTGPDGHFIHRSFFHGDKIVMIAGGSGITPFMSMLQTDHDKMVTGKEIDLIYGCAHEDDIIFKNRLEELAETGLFRLHPIISDPSENCSYRTGFITADVIKEIAGDVENTVFFLCGPRAMYEFVIPELEKLGVEGRNIIEEVQTMPADPTLLPGWPEGITSDNEFTITVSGGKSFKAKATETVLTAMEREGVIVPTSCRSGACSACRTKLVSGEVYHPGNELLRRADMMFGYMHPCVTYPISDIEILL